MARIPAAADAAEDETPFSQFEAMCSSWVAGYCERMGIASEGDASVREAQDAFVRELSAAGQVEVSLIGLADILEAIEIFAVRLEWPTPPERYLEAREEVKDLRRQVQALTSALQRVRGPLTAGVLSDVMSDLQSLLDASLLGRAFWLEPGVPSEKIGRGLRELDRRLGRYLRDWNGRYGLGKGDGRRPDIPVADFLHHLTSIYEDAGGRPSATWDQIRDRPQSPFAKFLVLIRAALPHELRRHASTSEPGFVTRAKRVVRDRKSGTGPLRKLIGRSLRRGESIE
jgi:hypothetical protein